jgi:hypothetical protein
MSVETFGEIIVMGQLRLALPINNYFITKLNAEKEISHEE